MNVASLEQLLNLQDLPVYNKVIDWLNCLPDQPDFINRHPRETWTPPPSSPLTRSASTSSRYHPYVKKAKSLINEPQKVAVTLRLEDAAEEITNTDTSSPAPVTPLREEQTPAGTPQYSPESPNSESWKFDPIFRWQAIAGYKQPFIPLISEYSEDGEFPILEDISEASIPVTTPEKNSKEERNYNNPDEDEIQPLIDEPQYALCPKNEMAEAKC